MSTQLTTNKIVTQDAIKDYDALLKQWLPAMTIKDELIDFQDSTLYVPNLQARAYGLTTMWFTPKAGDTNDNDVFLNFLNYCQCGDSGVKYCAIDWHSGKNGKLKVTKADLPAFQQELAPLADVFTGNKAGALIFKYGTHKLTTEDLAVSHYATLLEIPREDGVTHGQVAYSIINHSSSSSKYYLKREILLDTKTINQQLNHVSSHDWDTAKFPVNKINYYDVNGSSTITDIALWGSTTTKHSDDDFVAYTPHKLNTLTYNANTETLSAQYFNGGLPSMTAATDFETTDPFIKVISNSSASEVIWQLNDKGASVTLPAYAKGLAWKAAGSTSGGYGTGGLIAIDGNGVIVSAFFNGGNVPPRFGGVRYSNKLLSDDFINGVAVSLVFNKANSAVVNNAIKADKILVNSTYYKLTTSDNTLILTS